MSAEPGHTEGGSERNGVGGEEVERIRGMATRWRIGGKGGAFERNRENAHGKFRLNRPFEEGGLS